MKEEEKTKEDTYSETAIELGKGLMILLMFLPIFILEWKLATVVWRWCF